MEFFKPSARTISKKSVIFTEVLTWILIYGGLLSLVFGLWVTRIDDDMGWLLATAGGLAAGLGVFLIYIRSRFKTNP